MNKIKYVLCAAVLFLAGCGSYVEQPDNNELNVTTTIFPSYDFTREIAGEKANINLLLPPGSDAHSFEPSPKDIINIQNADLFIYTGGESDSWIDDILDTIDTGNTKIIKLMDVCSPMKEEIPEGMQTEEHDHGESEYDEHAWTSPKNAVLITEAISDTLCEIDNSNSALYKENTDEYIKQLNELDIKFENIVNSAKRNTVIFADRFPFLYFAKEYGLKYYAAFPGCAEETEPDIATVAFLIDKVRKEQIPVVFYIEFSNHKLADTVSEETGAKTMLLHSCHNVTKEEFDSGITYIDLMNNNAEALREALN